MRKVIYKYHLDPCIPGQPFDIELPKKAKILCVQTQRDRPCIWVELYEPSAEKLEKRTFIVFQTGQVFNISLDMKYIGTIQQMNGNYVLHLYEITIS